MIQTLRDEARRGGEIRYSLGQEGKIGMIWTGRSVACETMAEDAQTSPVAEQIWSCPQQCCPDHRMSEGLLATVSKTIL